jgi:hypothetical protein
LVHDAPEVTLSYDGDDYVLEIEDEIGIWKVVDDNGEEELDDNTYETIVSRTMEDVTEITVYNHAGDKTVLELEKTAPTVEGITYSGENYVIEMTDSDSGIWKVVDDNGETGVTSNIHHTTVTRAMEGVTEITVYDRANNHTTVQLEKTAPTVVGPTYDGDDYVIQISDSDSGIWKVVDDNGEYSASAGTFRHSIYGVSEITVYDKANNGTTVQIETTKPDIEFLGYSEGKYRLSVSDDDSGLWKVIDGTGEAQITGNVIEREKKQGEETIYVYDKAGNSESVVLSETSIPKIIYIYKDTDSTKIKVKATDESVDLWKVAESIGGVAKGYFDGKTSEIECTLSSSDVERIYIYNHAGNYKEVILEQYESIKFKDIRIYMGEMVEDNQLVVYDGVGNTQNVTLVHDAPEVTI